MVSSVGGIAALVVAATLLVGLVAAGKGVAGWRPWLTILFSVNAGRIPRDSLRGVRPVDVALLLLAGASFTGFWPGPGTSDTGWMTIAIAQPALGIPLLAATRILGRSGLMGGGLVLAILMVAGDEWVAAGWWGVAANLLLLIGDFGTTGRRSRPIAAAVAIGYAALVVWFGWLGLLLLA